MHDRACQHALSATAHIRRPVQYKVMHPVLGLIQKHAGSGNLLSTKGFDLWWGLRCDVHKADSPCRRAEKNEKYAAQLTDLCNVRDHKRFFPALKPGYFLGSRAQRLARNRIYRPGGLRYCANMEITQQNLQSEVVDLIVDSLNLHFIEKGTVDQATPLMGDGLGLDSVDILEVVVAVEQRYGVKIASAEQGREVFQTVGTIVDYVAAHRSGAEQRV